MDKPASTAESLRVTARDLKRAKELLEEMVKLVEWWAPKDGTPRTAEARAFLGHPQLGDKHGD